MFSRTKGGECSPLPTRRRRTRCRSLSELPSRTAPRPQSRRLTRTKMRAGMSMPPTAAAMGSAARAGSRRSPATNSRLSSSPTTKKKIASSPSAAHVSSGKFNPNALGPIRNSESASYVFDHGEFAQTSATTVATSNRAPPTVSPRNRAAMRVASVHEPRAKSARLPIGGWDGGSSVMEQPAFGGHCRERSLVRGCRVRRSSSRPLAWACPSADCANSGVSKISPPSGSSSTPSPEYSIAPVAGSTSMECDDTSCTASTRCSSASCFGRSRVEGARPAKVAEMPLG